jgi:uncharacterized protein (DUF302 family)
LTYINGRHSPNGYGGAGNRRKPLGPQGGCAMKLAYRHMPITILTAVLLAIAPLAASAGENPAFWKLKAKGNFSEVMAQIKRGLEAGQFQLTGEENLSKGLENNKQLFPGGKWNTIGFDNVTAVHFCSIVFNQEVFNIDLDWSILCPFKLVAFTTKMAPREVTIVMVKPSYLLAKDSNKKAAEIGKKIEDRIVAAIKDGLAH